MLPLLPLLLLLLLSGLPAQAPTTSVAAQYADITSQDAREYAITLRVDLDNKHLEGDVRYTFTAIDELKTIRLDALQSADWNVSFTSADGKPLDAVWEQDHVTLTLPTTAPKGSDVHFAAHLSGTPIDGFYFRDNRYHERMAFTDHYATRAHGWLPCEDNPSDRARFSLLLFWPNGNQAVGYGAPAALPAGSAPEPDGYRGAYLSTDTEIPPYMFAIVVGPLARVHEDGDHIILDHFVYRSDVDKAKAMLTHDAQWLHTMENTFGPYAFGKYTTVQCPTRWGGFEAPGNVQLAENLFDDPTAGTGTLAHELVHMWFGDGVGYAEWNEVWLSEGFASYFGPWLHEQAGGPSLHDSLVDMRRRWRQSVEGRTKSIRDDHYQTPVQVLNANTYPKAGWVLHMLRGELGDEQFFGALKAYYEKFRGQAVRTSDLLAVVNEHSKQDLGWFFSQWLDRVGCPELKVTPDGEALLVTQMQKGDPYTFWLRVRTGTGTEQKETRVRITQMQQRVKIEGPATNLVVDPAVELLYREAH